MDCENENEIGMEELVTRVSGLTETLLADGADAAELAFVLASVAADMGLQLTGDPNKVFPVLLSAIANQASKRLEADEADAGEETEIPIGATVH